MKLPFFILLTMLFVAGMTLVFELPFFDDGVNKPINFGIPKYIVFALTGGAASAPFWYAIKWAKQLDSEIPDSYKGKI